MRFTLRLIVVLITVALSGTQAIAQDEAKQPTEKAQGGGDLRAAVQNPVGANEPVRGRSTWRPTWTRTTIGWMAA